MDIESHVGEGTRVTVHLPLDCEQARRRSEVPGPALPRIDDARADLRAEIRSDLRLDSVVKKSA